MEIISLVWVRIRLIHRQCLPHWILWTDHPWCIPPLLEVWTKHPKKQPMDEAQMTSSLELSNTTLSSWCSAFSILSRPLYGVSSLARTNREWCRSISWSISLEEHRTSWYFGLQWLLRYLRWSCLTVVTPFLGPTLSSLCEVTSLCGSACYESLTRESPRHMPTCESQQSSRGSLTDCDIFANLLRDDLSFRGSLCWRRGIWMWDHSRWFYLSQLAQRSENSSLIETKRWHLSSSKSVLLYVTSQIKIRYLSSASLVFEVRWRKLDCSVRVQLEILWTWRVLQNWLACLELGFAHSSNNTEVNTFQGYFRESCCLVKSEKSNRCLQKLKRFLRIRVPCVASWTLPQNGSKQFAMHAQQSLLVSETGMTRWKSWFLKRWSIQFRIELRTSLNLFWDRTWNRLSLFSNNRWPKSSIHAWDRRNDNTKKNLCKRIKSGRSQQVYLITLQMLQLQLFEAVENVNK